MYKLIFKKRAIEEIRDSYIYIMNLNKKDLEKNLKKQ